MKPTLSVAASFVALLVLGGTALAEMPKAVGEGEGEVDIVAWPGYIERGETCLLYTSPSPRDGLLSRMPSSA